MALTLISTHTASADSSIDITSGIDSTYDSYEFRFVNMHPATDEAHFSFQVNASGQTGFNEVMTTTFYEAGHRESDSYSFLGYNPNEDQAQGTAYQILSRKQESANDANSSGVLTLYAPSSTTYVKHFTARTHGMHTDSGVHLNAYTLDDFVAGYINVTAAIDEISFKYSSGNIDAGTIKMFGVS